MRISAADTNGHPGNPGATDFQKQTKKEARRRRVNQAAKNFASDLQTGVIVCLLLFSVGAMSIIGLRSMGFESELVAFKHLAAATDCFVAKSIGMAPVGMDEPGYWMHLDADKDGTTCEEDER